MTFKVGDVVKLKDGVTGRFIPEVERGDILEINMAYKHPIVIQYFDKKLNRNRLIRMKLGEVTKYFELITGDPRVEGEL